jgi:hypothetical protein
MTTSRADRAINSRITRSWSAFGLRRTVCSVVTTGAFNSRSRVNKVAAGRSAEDSELVLERDHVHVAGVQEVGGAPVRIEDPAPQSRSERRPDIDSSPRCH